MPSSVTPPALVEGSTVAFVSPSGRLNEKHPAAIQRAAAVFTRRGYRVRILFTADTGVQSSITHRHAELRAAFLDPSIRAVICTIGGEAFTQLLPTLIEDEDLCAGIRKDPKVVVGSSDITGLHWLLYAVAGVRSFYGPSVIQKLGTVDPIDDENTTPLAFCISHLFKAITESKALGDIPRSPIYAPEFPAYMRDPGSVEVQKVVPAPNWQWLRRGRGKGRLFGGCLTVVVRLNGIPAIRPDWHGSIVFLESSSGDAMNLGSVRRTVADLIAQCVFDEASGLVIGRPFGYDSKEQREAYAGVFTELLCERRLGPAKNKNQFPILYGVDVGHTTPMVTLPYDALALLDSDKDQFAILESGVK